MKRHALIAAAAIAVIALPFPGIVTPAAAQWTVFDPSNYAQNVLTAARTLQQINNQIQALQNQATMLTNMAKQLQQLDFSSLVELNQAMQRIDALMASAEGIAFDLASTEVALTQHFPADFDTALTTSEMIQRARDQFRASMQGYRQTMRVQAQVVENVQADRALLTELVARSQSATGSLQAQQAGNQLMALAARQQLQLQSMLAAQHRAEAVEQARQAQAMEAARERTRRFVGSANAYTPE